MTVKRTKATEPDAAVQEGRGYHGWSKAAKRPGEEFEGFVHRILGPDGKEWRRLARSIYGHVAHGRTPESRSRTSDTAWKRWPQRSASRMRSGARSRSRTAHES
jgi:hypothetical protein